MEFFGSVLDAARVCYEADGRHGYNTCHNMVLYRALGTYCVSGLWSVLPPYLKYIPYVGTLHVLYIILLRAILVNLP